MILLALIVKHRGGGGHMAHVFFNIYLISNMLQKVKKKRKNTNKKKKKYIKLQNLTDKA